jgi:hypothetical protein
MQTIHSPRSSGKNNFKTSCSTDRPSAETAITTRLVIQQHLHSSKTADAGIRLATSDKIVAKQIIGKSNRVSVE